MRAHGDIMTWPFAARETALLRAVRTTRWSGAVAVFSLRLATPHLRPSAERGW
jgi:hypothetical protein